MCTYPIPPSSRVAGVLASVVGPTRIAHLPALLVLAALTTLQACAQRDEAGVTEPTPTDLEKWMETLETQSGEPEQTPATAPEPPWKSLRYSLDLRQVPMEEVVRQLAADAQLQLFIGTPIRARLNLHAREQPLEDILFGMERQSQYFVAIEQNTLVVLPNDHEMRTYAVGYPNTQRQTRSHIQTSLQLSVNGGGNGTPNNQSLTEVSNTSENLFWPSLVHTIESILAASGAGGALPGAQPGATGTVIAHPESGRVMVYANRRQHRVLSGEIDKLMKNMYRQVLIEATVLEIELSNKQRNGLDWQAILGGRWRVWQQDAVGSFQPSFGVRYSKDTTNGITSALIHLLETFGRVRVVSQPKLMALNNQSAVLKVVDERVYFTTQVESTFNENNSNISYETTIHSVPVGFTMSITPWISENSEVILNLKPSLTRIVRMVADPNPTLAEAKVVSQVPELQIREMETIMRIRNGQVGVIGGLIQETDNRKRSGIPGLHKARGVGWLFGSREKDIRRSELLILLRPVVDSG